MCVCAHLCERSRVLSLVHTITQYPVLHIKVHHAENKRKEKTRRKEVKLEPPPNLTEKMSTK